MSNPQKQKSGIYQIINKLNGKFYIGSAKNLSYRRTDHFWRLRNSRHHNRYLQNVYNKHGKEALEFKVLFYCDVRLLLLFEQIMLDKLKPDYNLCLVAGSCLGIKLSEEHKKKIGLSNKGKTGHPSWNKGKHLSEETKLKISAKLIGRPAMGRPRGIPLSDELKNRMSKLRKGILKSEETKKKMSLATKKRWEDGVYDKSS